MTEKLSLGPVHTLPSETLLSSHSLAYNSIWLQLTPLADPTSYLPTYSFQTGHSQLVPQYEFTVVGPDWGGII